MLFFISHKTLSLFGLTVEMLGPIVVVTYIIISWLLPSLRFMVLALAALDILLMSKMLLNQKLTLKVDGFPVIFDGRRHEPPAIEKLIQKDITLSVSTDGHFEEDQQSEPDLGSITVFEDQGSGTSHQSSS